jgi:NADH dehydrogenase
MVLGGTGFIGRHVARALRERGHAAIIGTRRPRRALARLPADLRDCDLRETHLEFLTTRYCWKPLLRGVEVVVNAVGILRERGCETYDRVHNMAPGALAVACERLHLRLIHVSALGLRKQALSRFIHSKILAERAIAATAADYSIVRPSLLDGDGGFGAEWIRRVARWPVHFIPVEAQGRMAPLHVRDLGEAIAVLCEARARPEWREVELGGGVRRTMADYLASLRALHDERPALRIPVPRLPARIAAHLCDLLHFSPFSFGHLELLRRDNAPRENLLAMLIGRAPTPVGREPRELRPAYAFRGMPAGHETPVPPSPQ